MNREHQDRILDACLGEVLGGDAPPDLTARILEAWEERSGEASTSSSVEASPTAVPFARPIAPPTAPIPPAMPQPPHNGRPGSGEPVAPQVALSTQESVRRRRSRNQRQISALALTLLIVVAGFSIGAIALMLSQSGSGPRMAGDSEDNRSGEPEVTPETPRIVTPRTPSTPNPVPNEQPEVPEGTRPAAPVLAHGSSGNSSSPGDGSPAPSPDSSPASTARPPWMVSTPAPPLDDAEVIARANDLIRRQWEENGVQPAVPATDAEWCRRTYLALIGRIPTVNELTTFLASEDANKREQLVDRLQTDEAYAEEYALNWGTYWTNVLIGRTGGTRPDDLSDREGLLKYLRDAMQNDRPFNRIAYELIAATGSNQPGTPEFNGATNFLLSSLDDKAVLATARTSRIFHGQQIQCVQCHNHPSSNNEWTQNRFWELNAFFRQVDVEKDRESGSVRLVDRDFLGEGGGDGEEAEIYYEELNGYTRAVYPRFPGAQPIPPSGLVDEVNRRAELAKIIATAEDLSDATVNRLWGQMFGFGFTRPVDDMGPHNPPSHPALLELLSEQFAANDYSTKKLIRWMALSEPFGLSSKIQSENAADTPEIGSVAYFSRYYTRQMGPEAVYDSLLILAQANEQQRAGEQLDNSIAARTTWLGQFLRNMETDEGQEDTTFDGGIRQSLIMMNGPLMEQATRIEPGSLLHQLLHSELPLTEKIDHLFLAAVARHPSKQERRLLQRLSTNVNGPDAQAQILQSVWWALLNSNEFILDH